MGENNVMRKWKLKNAALYLLFGVNCASAAKNGIDWLFGIAAALTAIVLFLDIREVMTHGRKE